MKGEQEEDMLELYYGRESIDKDRFIFDRIAKAAERLGEEGCAERILLIVPDQFTLQAERNAVAYLDVDGLMDIEVLSLSRLCFKVLSETGDSDRVAIDKYGRHMLLAKIIADEDDRLTAFRGMKQKHAFIDMTNNLISEMKQFHTAPGDLAEMIDSVRDQPILCQKLEDIHRLYEKYEEAVEDKYIDTEDHLDLFIRQISRSELVKGAEIFVSGFDAFTPKNLDILGQLLLYARKVSVVLTGTGKDDRDADLFELTKRQIYRLRSAAADYGIAYSESAIDDSYSFGSRKGTGKRTPALAHLERELYAQPFHVWKETDGREAVRFCKAGGFYGEAETAAARIVQLVRDEGLRYKEIAVICNDMDNRASVIKRVFEEYGISVFVDKKRGITHNPWIEYITALLDIVVKGWKYEDVFQMIKTGLSPVSDGEWERLENYALKYKIRGNRWKNGFQYGVQSEGEEALAELNDIRSRFAEPIAAFEADFKKAKTAGEKTKILYYFLREQAGFYERTEELVAEMNRSHAYEAAEELAQICGVITGLFDQLAELIGEMEMNAEEYGMILRAGFEGVEIGLIPPTVDQVVVGTMQRTRTGDLKALFVIGANDGILPAAGGTEGLLSEDEKMILLERKFEICKDDDLRAKEERLAIYKTFAKPERYLWIGYSAADLEGREIKPSMIFDKLRRIFPQVIPEKDIISSEEPIKLIETPKSTLKYMTEALREAADGGELAAPWKEAGNWYRRSAYCEKLRIVKDGLLFTNSVKKLDAALVRKLYAKGGMEDIVLSPSRLEKFSRCPFAHFVNFGLSPEELRVFEVAGREMGDIYHQCLMELAEHLTVPGVDITSAESPWMKLSKAECASLVDRLVDGAAAEYREGVLMMGEEEAYRSGRIKTVCEGAAWALVEHVQKGDIRRVFFETEFGRNGRTFPPVAVETEGGTVYIEGKIDRVDELSGRLAADMSEGGDRGEGTPASYVKIIDYKSGREKFNIDEAKAGWRLQLMLYLRAAMNGIQAEGSPPSQPGQQQSSTESGTGAPRGRDVKPAGVFYFEVAEPMIDVSGLSQEELADKLAVEIKRSFKLDGVVLDDKAVIEQIAGEFTGSSEVIPIKKTKDGTYAGTTESKLLPEAEFQELQEAVDSTIEALCGELASGAIGIKPKRTKYETACKYCRYKSICNFDTGFEGCGYEKV